MLTTPTYHVFEMYSVHQDAAMVPVHVQCETYGHGDYSVPAVSASASVDDGGRLNVSLSNADPHRDLPVRINVRGMRGSRVEGRLLRGSAMNAHNTFENPDAVKPESFTAAKASDEGVELTLPRMSVAVIRVD
jgi:alpha-N-arabinofuranosidase